MKYLYAIYISLVICAFTACNASAQVFRFAEIDGRKGILVDQAQMRLYFTGTDFKVHGDESFGAGVTDFSDSSMNCYSLGGIVLSTSKRDDASEWECAGVRFQIRESIKRANEYVKIVRASKLDRIYYYSYSLSRGIESISLRYKPGSSETYNSVDEFGLFSNRLDD